MVRTFVILLLALAAISLTASPSAARPRFGVVAGAQLTELTPRSYEFLGKPDVKWSWTGGSGLLAELPLPGGFALATGVEYGEHRDDQTATMSLTLGSTTVTAESQRELRMRTLALPLRVEWRPGHWRLGAGPEVRYLASADQRLSVSSPVVDPGPTKVAAARGRSAQPDAVIFETLENGKWYDETDQFRRWSLAAQFAVGREIPLGAHVLRADLRWSEGITDQQWAQQATQRTRAAQLALGFLW